MTAPQQQTLFPILGVIKLANLGGLTEAVLYEVKTLEGAERYVVKSLKAEFPLMLVAESICSAVGLELGLPLLQPVNLPIEGELTFATRWIASERSPWFGPDLNACGNVGMPPQVGIVPDILAFDILVANPDRRAPNVIVERLSDDPLRNWLWIIDHTHALAFAGETEQLTEDAYLEMPIDKERVKSKALFGPIIERVRGLSLGFWHDVCSNIPAAWVPDRQQLAEIEKTLAFRGANIEQLIDSAFQGELR